MQVHEVRNLDNIRIGVNGVILLPLPNGRGKVDRKYNIGVVRLRE
jgi:hypothetical protein